MQTEVFSRIQAAKFQVKVSHSRTCTEERKVQYHPRDQNKVLVCPMKSAPVMLTLSDSKHDSDLNVVASFDRRGEYIYTGNAKGKILVLKTDSQDLVASFRVTTGTSNTTAIKSIEFARKGR